MNKPTTIVTLALGAVVASLGSVPSASAAPSTTGLDGLLCGLYAVAEPTAAPGLYRGEVVAGPAFVDDGGRQPGIHSGQFICTVQVGAANSTHAGADAAVVPGLPTTGMITAQGRSRTRPVSSTTSTSARRSWSTVRTCTSTTPTTPR
ncbi:MAG: hypothetical protein QOE45_855 [Frankiaceae bacterium]|nr:hypothetical protein [Frankiaceae bacterium]